MSRPCIALDAVTKRYGALVAVNEVSLALGEGERLALLGHNGAGKTTLIKLILGLTRPAEGRIEVMGRAPGARGWAKARRAIGFVPENVAFSGAMTGRELITFYGRLKGESRRRSLALLERVGLDHAAAKPVKTYSKGMRQRLGLAQALLGKPRLLLLDEPTSGLDPRFRRRVYESLRELTAAGTTVLLSSHMLTELEAETDRVAIMTSGRLVAHGSLAELRRAAGLPVRLRVALAEPAAQSPAMINGFPITRLGEGAFELRCPDTDKIAAVRQVLGLGAAVRDLEILSPSLTEIYAHFQDREA